MNYDYDKISEIYDNVRTADLKAVEFMIEKTRINKESRVLELGCGTANYLSLIGQLTQADIWGADQSEGMLSKAREKSPKAVFVEDDAVYLSKIPDAYFDLVYMVDVIHHIKDIGTMFFNIKRVLKENGKVIIFSDSHEHIRNRLTTKYFPETLEPEIKRYPDTPEIIQNLLKNGFKGIESGTLEIGMDNSFGQRLIEIASSKGYSMFGAIPEEAINRGIERIKEDMLKQAVVYNQRAPYIMAVK